MAVFRDSEYLADFRKAGRGGDARLHRPGAAGHREGTGDKHAAKDTTHREPALAELEAMTARNSQYNPGNEMPEEHWMYRLAKKH